MQQQAVAVDDLGVEEAEVSPARNRYSNTSAISARKVSCQSGASA